MSEGREQIGVIKCNLTETLNVGTPEEVTNTKTYEYSVDKVTAEAGLEIIRSVLNSLNNLSKRNAESVNTNTVEKKINTEVSTGATENISDESLVNAKDDANNGVSEEIINDKTKGMFKGMLDKISSVAGDDGKDDELSNNMANLFGDYMNSIRNPAESEEKLNEGFTNILEAMGVSNSGNITRNIVDLVNNSLTQTTRIDSGFVIKDTLHLLEIISEDDLYELQLPLIKSIKNVHNDMKTLSEQFDDDNNRTELDKSEEMISLIMETEEPVSANGLALILSSLGKVCQFLLDNNIQYVPKYDNFDIVKVKTKLNQLKSDGKIDNDQYNTIYKTLQESFGAKEPNN